MQEMGKSRAAAFALGLQDIDEGVQFNTYNETVDSVDSDVNETAHPEGVLSFLFLCCSIYLMIFKRILVHDNLMFSFQEIINDCTW